DLLRVLTSPSEVRAGVIRQVHERPDGQELADLLVFLEEGPSGAGSRSCLAPRHGILSDRRARRRLAGSALRRVLRSWVPFGGANLLPLKCLTAAPPTHGLCLL